jgi:hypothetical protein
MTATRPRIRQAAVLGLITLLAMVVQVGCSSSPGRYTIMVSPGQSLKDSGGAVTDTFQVDLVGVSEAEAPQWRNKPLAEYFQGGDKLRASADRKTLQFSREDSITKTLERNDPIWDTWAGKGATELFAMVNISGVKEPLILPLDRARWDAETIAIEVRSSGLVPQTPMKPAK